MFHRPYRYATALIAAASLPAAVAAAPAVTAPFAGPAVPDRVLSEISGTASPYAPLSRGNFTRFAEMQSRDDARVFGAIAGLQMDAWWSTIGSELIANATRNQ